MKIPYIIILMVGALALSACEKKTPEATPVTDTNTFETKRLEEAIDAYKQNPTQEQELKVEQAFNELEGEITELEGKVATSSGDSKAEAQAKLNDLRTYQGEQRARFIAEKTKAAGNNLGEKIEDTADKVGNTLEKAAEDVGQSMENAGDKIKDAVTPDNTNQ